MNDLHFGVCIRIDRYPGFPGRDLGSAARDAKAFRSWLTAEDGLVRSVAAELLPDGRAEQARAAVAVAARPTR